MAKSELDKAKDGLLYASNIMDFLIDHTTRSPSKVCDDCEEMVDDFHQKYKRFFPDGHVPDGVPDHDCRGQKACPVPECPEYAR